MGCTWLFNISISGCNCPFSSFFSDLLWAQTQWSSKDLHFLFATVQLSWSSHPISAQLLCCICFSLRLGKVKILNMFVSSYQFAHLLLQLFPNFSTSILLHCDLLVLLELLATLPDTAAMIPAGIATFVPYHKLCMDMNAEN